MNNITVRRYSDELYHHGIMGQKWGIRRYQNSDGSLTAAGRERYGVGKASRNVGRAITNTALGQRLAVNMNKGYKADKKEIKSLSKEKRAKIKESNLDKDTKKQKLSELKEDTKRTLGEARVATAKATYSWQSDAANERIQTASVGKQLVKSMLLGGYGALTYDRVKADKGKAAVGKSLVMGYLDVLSGGSASVIDYAANKSTDKNNKKKP